MHDNDSLDLLIDSALENYADPGPDSGLEQRVLCDIGARISTEDNPLRLARWIPWAIALPVAACLLFYFASAPKPADRPSGSVAQSPQAHEPVVDPAYKNRDVRTALSPNRRRQFHKAQPLTVNPLAKSAPLRKLDVFPTPRPLTPEEQALLVIANQSPKPELAVLVKAQTQDEAAPINIAAIHIPPLDPPEPDGN